MYGTALYGSEQYCGAGYTKPRLVALLPGQAYVMHLRKVDGEFIGKLTGWSDNAGWEERSNSASKLNFDVPLSNDLVPYLVWPNRVWLYDSALKPLGRFIIQVSDSEVGGDRARIKVTCKDLMSQLDGEDIVAYGDPNDDPTILDHLTAWFSDYQQSGSPVVLGYIHPGIANRKLKVGIIRRTTILRMLRKIQEAGVGGLFRIDEHGKFRWDGDYSAFAKKLVTLRHGMALYREKNDTSGIFNRLTVIGGLGYSSRRTVTLPAPGYVEDTASQALHGAIHKRIYVRWYRDQDTLLAYANQLLKEGVQGDKKRSAEIVDFSKVWTDPDNPVAIEGDDVYVGAPMIVNPHPLMPEASGIYKTTITSVKRKLVDRGVVSVSFGKRAAADFIWKLEELRRRVDEIEIEGGDEDDTLSSEIQGLELGIVSVHTRIDGLEGEEDIQAVSNTNTDGDSDGYAKKNHTHDGIEKWVDQGVYKAVGDFPAPGGGAWVLAVITDTDATVPADAGVWEWLPGSSSWSRPKGYWA